MAGYPAKPVYLRFTRKFVYRGQCWMWTGAIMPNGYGVFGLPKCITGVRHFQVYAHRWSYEYHIGPIPEGLEIDHTCRNRSCVNPFHMEAVTHTENMARMEQKTHCVNGHEFTEANTWRNKRGFRFCRQCRRDREVVYARRRAKR